MLHPLKIIRMKGYFTTFSVLFLFFTGVSFAQYTITIDLVAFDRNTNKSIPFATAGFKGKNIQTIGNKSGRFILKYNENSIGKNDVFEVKALGYQNFSLPANRIFDYFKKPVVYLKPDKNYYENGGVAGKVRAITGPLEGAQIKVLHKLQATVSDASGHFSINAIEGDTLNISFFGMISKKVVVYDDREIDVFLYPEAELLDEIFITADSIQADRIDMGYNGKKNVRELGYATYYLTDEQIPDHYASLAALLNGRFPGVRAIESPFGTKVLLRETGSIYDNSSALFDIDGMLYENNAPYINPQDIESISILKTLAATNKYGSSGRGGVVVIRTKSGYGNKIAQKKALVEGNDYNENLPDYKTLVQHDFYVRAYENTTSVDEAKELYARFENLKTNRGIPFFINSAAYFSRFDRDFAQNILSEAIRFTFSDPLALRSIAFQSEHLGFYSQALQIYQRIAVLEPKKTQTYIDLAESMVDNGFYREAMKLYRKMLFNQIKNVDFSEVQQFFTAQMTNLISLHRTKVYFKGLPEHILVNELDEPVRIFFEWNDPFAEFELQFVNPMKKYFIWSHTQTGNPDRIKQEFKTGSQSKSFLIDETFPGTWIVNFNNFYKSNPLNPVYLKYTVYRNYGTPSQTKTLILIRPDRFRQKVTLDRITVK